MAPGGRRRQGQDEQGGAAIRSSLAAVRDTPRYTYLVAAMAAIGGALFGYDIGVISGAENLLKSAYHLSSGTEELAVAAVLIGAVVGGVIGGPMANRFSRRYTLLAMAILYAIGAPAPRRGAFCGSFAGSAVKRRPFIPFCGFCAAGFPAVPVMLGQNWRISPQMTHKDGNNGRAVPVNYDITGENGWLWRPLRALPRK